MRAGLDPSQFWELTFREIDVILAGAADRRRDENNGHAWLAWHIEALHRQKKLPRLDRLLDMGTPRRKTPEQMKAILRAWTATGRQN